LTVAFAQAHSPVAAEALCPLCGAASGTPAWRAADGARAVHRCGACGLTFAWPRIGQDFTDVPEAFYYHSFEALDLDGPGFLFADVVAAIGRRTAQRIGNEERRLAILDAGCGAGHALLTFRAHDWQVAGVDPWPAVTEIGRKYYRLPIRTGRLEDVPLDPAAQDVVLALDVLQFVADPKAFLAAALGALRPGGLLYLTVPNFGSVASRRDGWDHVHFSPLVYLSYFDETTIRRLLEQSGFYRVQVLPYGGPDGDEHLKVLARRAVATALDWPDLAEEVPDAELPPLDRSTAAMRNLTPEQEFWRENGYLVLPGLIPDELIDRYCEVRRKMPFEMGWESPMPYVDVPEIRDLCLYKPLADMMEHLMGEPVGLHLNLTGWVSTERDWHQDDYLNPPKVNGHYIAAWMALDRIAADAGPFEFVPGSHRWPIIRQAKVLAQLGYENGDDPAWAWDSERILTPFFERQIRERGAKTERFLGNRGDVLLWHARLLHRGSLPLRPGAERRSMIAHYTALSHREDMPVSRRHRDGGWYFLLGAPPDEGWRRLFRWPG
jgi:SAM-dependent methyltransferase